MTIKISSQDPKALLEGIKTSIEQGHIKTWSLDSQGDFTHNVTQWDKKAWLRPKIQNAKLELVIIAPKDSPITTEIFAVYHGRFIEMLTAHFSKYFVSIETSPAR